MFARDYRELARECLRGNWKLSVGTAMMACLLGGLLTGSTFFPELELKIEDMNFRDLKELFTFVLFNGGLVIQITSVLNLLHFILGGVIQLGYASYLLKQCDRREPQFNDLFSKFDYFGAGFCQAFLRYLYIFLWGLLFIIPGIVAQYRYAMTPFIMAEHPELTASEAITASKKMMNGHKWELFCLDMSFIGWAFLCVLTFDIGYIFLNPYVNASHAAFYRRVSVSDPYNEL